MTCCVVPGVPGPGVIRGHVSVPRVSPGLVSNLVAPPCAPVTVRLV